MLNFNLFESFLYSLDLGLKTFVVSTFLGISLGFLSYRFVTVKKWVFFSSVLVVSIPKIAIAVFLQLLFANYLRILPVAGYGTFKHTILPIITLSLAPTFIIAKMFYISLSNVMQKEYIQFARLKKLSPSRIFFRHALANSVSPVVAYVGKLFTNIITNSILIEKIFLIPGLGNLFIDSIMERKQREMIFLVFIYYLFVNVIFLIKDYIYVWLEPKVDRETNI